MTFRMEPVCNHAITSLYITIIYRIYRTRSIRNRAFERPLMFAWLANGFWFTYVIPVLPVLLVSAAFVTLSFLSFTLRGSIGGKGGPFLHWKSTCRGDASLIITTTRKWLSYQCFIAEWMNPAFDHCIACWVKTFPYLTLQVCITLKNSLHETFRPLVGWNRTMFAAPRWNQYYKCCSVILSNSSHAILIMITIPLHSDISWCSIVPFDIYMTVKETNIYAKKHRTLPWLKSWQQPF